MALQPYAPNLGTILANNQSVEQQYGPARLAQLAIEGFRQGQENKLQKEQLYNQKKQNFLKTTIDLANNGIDATNAIKAAGMITGFQDLGLFQDLTNYVNKISENKKQESDLLKEQNRLNLEKTRAETQKLQTDPYNLREFELKKKIEADINTNAERKKLELKKFENQPRIEASLEKRQQDTQRTLNLIDKSIAEVDSTSSGPIGALLQHVPGTDARNLKATIDTIKGNIGFDTLQALRDASPTGGALGQVSDREIYFLQSVLANLEQSQSPDQLRENLKTAKEQIKASLQRVQDSYQKDYGNMSYQQNKINSSIQNNISEGATATNPQTGQRIIYRGGKWQKLN